MNMITKKSLLITSLLIATISINFPPNTASASVFDWIFGNTVDYQSPTFSFAGVDHETGLNLVIEPTFSEKPSAWQFLNSSAVMAMNAPSSSKKIADKFGQKTFHVPSTAYSSTKDQTDNTPFITAMGTHVRDGVVAANFLPLGTIFKIPEIFGDKVFVVEDRMNKRYPYRIDLWFPSREEANQWGLKKIKIEIVS